MCLECLRLMVMNNSEAGSRDGVSREQCWIPLLLWSKWVPDGFRPNRAHVKECDFDMPSCLVIAAALPRQCPWLRGGLQRDGQQGLCLKDLTI